MRLIEFEGRRIELPDDFTDDEAASVLQSARQATAPPTPEVQSAPQAEFRAGPSWFDRAKTNVATGAQAVGRGVARAAGLPIDLAAGAINLPIRGVNLAAGTNIPTIDKPWGGSE